MDSNTKKMTDADMGAPISSETAMTRFRKPLIDYLISGLEENDKWVRIFAAEMLGSAGDPRAVEYLKPLLVDRDPDLRTISVQVLDMIPPQQTALSRLLPDRCTSCMIRLIAEEALMRQNRGGKLHVTTTGMNGREWL